MSESKISRRRLLGTAAAAGTVGTFFGSWKFNSALAQSERPIKIGFTSDAGPSYRACSYRY